MTPAGHAAPAIPSRLHLRRCRGAGALFRAAGHQPSLRLADRHGAAGLAHGYDVIDATRVNPELGGEEGLRALSSALAAAGLGMILDIVPNHMAADTANAWWADVLRHGRASRFARWFDIDWDADDKVLLPILGRPLDEVLAAGELARDGDAFRLLLPPPARRRRRPGAASTGAWPGGAAPAIASTGGASSTSTSWSACAWRSPRPSRPSMPCRCACMPRASSTACASTMSMASAIPPPTAGPCARG